MTLELKIPPVVVFLAGLAAMWALAAGLPAAAFPLRHAGSIAAILGFAGLAAGAAGVLAFRHQQTTVHPMRPEKATSLVDTGIYRRTRNPMYLGLALLLLAFGTYLANAAALAVVPCFVAYMSRFQIAPEERALLGKFDGEYADYRARVRRWL